MHTKCMKWYQNPSQEEKKMQSAWFLQLLRPISILEFLVSSIIFYVYLIIDKYLLTPSNIDRIRSQNKILYLPNRAVDQSTIQF